MEDYSNSAQSPTDSFLTVEGCSVELTQTCPLHRKRERERCCFISYEAQRGTTVI